MGINQTSNAERLETEIVIIGGGGAGLAAAVTAGEKGVKSIVLEKRHNAGGNSVFAVGLFAAESPIQRRLMIDARRDELFKIAMDYAHWQINPRIVRAFIDKSGDTIQWLEEKGLWIDHIRPLYPNQVPLVWHCPRGGGTSVIKALIKNCEERGIQLLCQTAAKKILTDKKVNVAGVLAATKNTEFKIVAKSVIIATGGYGGNKELLKKYCPAYSDNIHLDGLPHMGDGLLMAMEIGAATEGLGILQLAGPRFPGIRHINSIAQEPCTLWVNKRGERFTDESLSLYMAEAANAVDRQPDKVSYTLLDQKVKQNIVEGGPIKGSGIFFKKQKGNLPELDRELQSEAKRGMIKISASWDDIARWIGTTPHILKATVDEYNIFCDQGYDAVFAKDRRYLQPLRTPPYYAIKCYSSFLNTIGGIKINHRMEVINQQDDPIPGLYATGVDTGGWESDTYCAILSGSTFSFAINSGRIAGENAAIYVSGK